MMRRLANSAFTLVELLVVIGVIALLISILLPSLNAAREFGRRAKCAANLHNVGIAMHQYGNDNEGVLPKVAWGTRDWRNIGLARANYITSDNLQDNSCNLRPLFLLIRLKYLTADQFVCPSSEDEAVPDDDVEDLWDFPSHTTCSYSYQNTTTTTLKLSGSEDLPIMADRNPQYSFSWSSSLDADRGDANTALLEEYYTEKGVKESANSENHRGAGQNVLSVSGAVRWFDTPLAGLSLNDNPDNIYTFNDGSKYGFPVNTTLPNGAKFWKSGPVDERDTWLVP